jgi:hypothetical protein
MAFVHGIFDESEVTTNNLSTWIKRKAQVEADRLQPYADILLDELVWPTMMEKKDSIAAQLKEKCETATEAWQIEVPIWTFNHCFDYPKRAAQPGTVAHGILLERGDENAKKTQQIYERGWHQWMEVRERDEDDADYPALPYQTIWQVVKKTHFLDELALRFGRDYRVTASTSPIYADGGDGELLYSVVTLKLNYFPFGLPDYHLKSQTAVREKLAVKERRILLLNEKLNFWRGEPVPLLGPAFWPPYFYDRSARPACHCCCDESEEE